MDLMPAKHFQIAQLNSELLWASTLEHSNALHQCLDFTPLLKVLTLWA